MMSAGSSQATPATRRMGLTVLGGAALLLAGALVAYGVGALGPKVLVLPIIAAIGLVLMLDPFWPLFLLVLSVPIDALFNRIFDPLPVSAGAGLTLMTMAAMVLRLPREPRAWRILPDDPTVRWALAFATALLISTILAEFRRLAIEDAARLSGQLLMMFLIVRIVQNQRQMQILIFGLIGATLFSAVIVLIEAKTGTHLLSRAKVSEFDEIVRSRGASDQNPTTAALMQTFGVTMAIALGLGYAKGRAVTLGTGVVGALGIIYSYARSAALTMIAVTMLIVWRHRRSRYFAMGAVLATIVMGATLPLVPSHYWQRLSMLANFDTDRTLWRRVGYNLIGLDLVAEHPLFGVGPGNFPQFYVNPQYRYIPGRTLEPRPLHNMYLGVAAEMGLIGAAAFVGMIASCLTRLMRGIARSTDDTAKAFATALLYGSAAYYLGSLVTPAQYVKFTWVLVGLAVVQARLMDAAARPSVAIGRPRQQEAAPPPH